MKKQTIMLTLATLLVLTGLGILVMQLRTQRTSVITTPLPPAQQAQAVRPAAELPAGYITGKPVQITVPSVGISVPIVPGYFDPQTGEWTLTLGNAQYATMTPEPNNTAGNTFIYGHARSDVFGRLPKVPTGGEAVVTTDNGHRFYYRLNTVHTVKPDDVGAALQDTDGPTLTLQTCTGLLYQNRQLFSFSLEKVV